MANVHEIARNRWPGILTALGVDPVFLTFKHKEGECPFCGGITRFRFDDKDGRGTFYCSHCKPGNGVEFVMRFLNVNFLEAAKKIESVAGAIPATIPTASPSDDEKRAICRKIWSEAKPVTQDDPVSTYLLRRTGINAVPACIRFHPYLAYRHDDGSNTRHPAMVAKAQDITGAGCAIHRTYLDNAGNKAGLPAAKKVLGTLPAGAAIQLLPPAECLGVAEGIETGLAAFELFGVATWAAVNSEGLKRWTPPNGVHRVVIFGDNDLSGTGQEAAWGLAKRLIATGIDTDVRIPEQAGMDWADVLEAKR